MHIRAKAVTSKRARAIRLALWQVNPNCSWCGRRTRLITSPDGILPDDAATVDHVISQYQRSAKTPTRVVLACHGCNQKRCDQETASISIERRRVICKSPPLPKCPKCGYAVKPDRGCYGCPNGLRK